MTFTTFEEAYKASDSGTGRIPRHTCSYCEATYPVPRDKVLRWLQDHITFTCPRCGDTAFIMPSELFA